MPLLQNVYMFTWDDMTLRPIGQVISEGEFSDYWCLAMGELAIAETVREV